MPFKVIAVGSLGVVQFIANILFIISCVWSSFYILPFLNTIHFSLGLAFILAITTYALGCIQSFLLHFIVKIGDDEDAS